MVGINKKLKGDTAELIVAAKFIADGFRVLFPYGENSRYDLVAEKNGKFFRVQVKYVTPKNGALEVNCRSSNNWSVIHYSKEDFDIIGVFDPILTPKIELAKNEEITKNKSPTKPIKNQ